MTPWCTPEELQEGAMIVLYRQGSSQGWLPAALHDVAKAYFEAVGSRFAEGFARIERRAI